MRFLIIAANLCTDPYPVYPLGMSVIAAAAEQAGHTVRQFDLLANGSDALPETIAKFHPEAIGISIRNLDTVNSRSSERNLLRAAFDTIALCRKFSGAPILLGGPGFSLLPEEILKSSGADFGIIGEGETAIVQLLSELEKGHFPEQRLFRGKTGPQSPALYPDDLLNYYGKETHIIPIQTKRGCPFSCAYCSYPTLEGRAVRERDPESVAQELESLSRRAPDAMFYFVDAVFNDPERKYHHLLNALRKRGLRIPFAAFLSPSHLTESDVELLSDSGMIAAELGIDASTDETLRGLRKNFTFEKAWNASDLLRKHGIGVTTNVMFGGPGETMETVRRGISNLRSLEPVHTLVFSGIRILPGTPLCEIAHQEGKLPADWNGSTELYYFADGLNPEQLHNTLTEGFRGSRFCIYPPDAKNGELKLLHKFGYAKLRRLQSGGVS